jgi:D-aminopeptidase
MVVATDLPLESRQLERLAKRAILGLARAGSSGENGSGDYVIAFSTTNRFPAQSSGQVGLQQAAEFAGSNTKSRVQWFLLVAPEQWDTN